MATFKAGDLAVIVVSVTGANLGKLVRVVDYFGDAGDVKWLDGHPFRVMLDNTLLIESLCSPLKYSDGYTCQIGPIPASFLCPIRGDETPESTETTKDKEMVA